MSGLSTPQPPPQTNQRPAVWDLVIEDMRERDASGLAKYGTRLQPGNGRDAIVDAYQEALDLVVYLRQAIEDRNEERATTNRLLDKAAKYCCPHLDVCGDSSSRTSQRCRACGSEVTQWRVAP